MPEIALDHRQVMDILPHREPMLLVDEVLQLKEMERITARLYINPDWDIFKGHFPGNPIMPGVLSVECMAQTADIMLMTAPRYEGLTPLFAGIDTVRFLSPIYPGDYVVSKVEVLEHIVEKKKVKCSGELYCNGDKLAVTAVLTIAMR